ncbi:hypothetical protein B0F90DRAFT_1810761 [Multifurca ochricompacta]|uniref:VHS domain-containing protein n=1 Tax=Multifurca ochricompacta TaxID=376703 RepID=A0AAD4M464_9AGAM|nr:hypothetical protein B0F90DRAFT_1810761 [Multifurca ochricompacta]
MRKFFARDKPKLAKQQEFHASQPHHPHYHSLQALHQLRSTPSSRDNHHHQQTSSDDDHWHVLPSDPSNTPDTTKHVPLTSSRSSSLASLPPGASPPLANPPINTPRTASPFPGTNSVRSSHTKDSREREKDRRGGTAAVSILNALNPQFAPPPQTFDPTRSLRDDETVVYAPSEGSIREERKERGGFWSWASTGERDRDRRDIRDREDGYLTATSSEDWAVVLEVCERASATEANAKEAAKALRREFKYGEAPQQLSAARLWAIMLRNSSELFVHQCMKSKFMDTLDDVLSSQRTSPVVRERLLDVLAAAAYASSATPLKSESSFRLLWRKVKPPGKPDEGVPFDPDDAMFNPPSPRRSSALNPISGYPPTIHPQSLQVTPVSSPQPQAPSQPQSQTQTQTQLQTQTQTQTQPSQPQPQPQNQTQTPASQPPTRTKRDVPNHGQLQRVIPPEEDMRRLFQECRFAHGNAQLLSEALAFASPEDLREKDIIKEWHTKCLTSQELIAAQIPWATAGADRSRTARETQQLQQQRTIKRRNSPNGPGTPNIPSKPRNKQGNGEESPVELTHEEQLLGALLEANEALTSVLRVYDDIERIGIERETMERSRQEVRLDRSKNVVDERGYVHRLDLPPTSLGSSSRSPSPSPSPSPKPPSLPIPVALQPHGGQPHPLPPIPVQHQQNYATPQPSLALPPPAPHGPRSPGLVMHRSHTPSPERGGFARPSLLTSVPNATDVPNGSASKPAVPSLGIIVSSGGDIVDDEEKEEEEEEDIRTPIRPSAKALGKRRLIEAEEPDPEAFNPDDIFYERTDVRDTRNPAPDDSGMSDSDSDSPHRGWPQPVHYAYDAVAERTQRLMQQMALVNGVH